MVVWLHLNAAFGILRHLCLRLGPRRLLALHFLLRHQHHFCHVYLLIQQSRRCSKSAMRGLEIVGGEGVVDLPLVAAQASIRVVLRAVVVELTST